MHVYKRRKMKILFVSQYYPDSIAEQCASMSKIGLDWAAHNLSKAIIQGLEDNGTEYSVLNVPMMGSFPPFCKKPLVPQTSGEKMTSIGYLNVTYLKRIDTKNRVLKAANKWCMQNSGDKAIIFYNYQYIEVITKLKQQHPDVKIVMLLTDLPEYTVPHETILTRLNNKISPLTNAKKGSHYELINGFIFLAEGMKDKMPVGNKPWLLMEGIYNNEICHTITSKDNNDIKSIMYTGNLGARYGIGILLEAFSKIKKDNYQLWIRGNGELENEIKTLAVKDKRIIYFERMSRKDLTEKQRQATLLVNPVPPSEQFTRYFFPSKTLEYMASGTPTLMFKLPCIPTDYHEHLLFIEEENAEHLSNKIMQICSKPISELNAFGVKASEFIYNNKTPKKQTEKIIDFLHAI